MPLRKATPVALGKGLFVIGIAGENFVAERDADEHGDKEQYEQAVHGDLRK